MYSACNGAVYAAFLVALALEGGASGLQDPRQATATGLTALGLLLYAALTATPTLAITVRRMHDTGRSGLSLWRAVLPNSWLWLLLNLTFDSQPGANKWGPNPEETQVPSPPA